MHRNRFLVNKTNRCTEFQFCWYYDSTCFGQSFCPSSGVFSCTSAVVHFMRLWQLFATRSRMELQFHSAPGSKRSSDLHKMYQCRCMTKNSWWWAERLPKTCRVIIPIKLEFSVSVSFIHKVLTVLVYMPFDHLMWLVVWESFTAFGDHESLRLYIIYHLYLYITACVNMKRSLKQVPWFRFEPVLSDYWSGVYCYVSVCGQCC